MIRKLFFEQTKKIIFEVIKNDELIFSKKALDRHAEEGEVMKLFESA